MKRDLVDGLPRTSPVPERPLPVAIIGVGCRLPGADGPHAYWELLRAGRDAVGDIPPDRVMAPSYALGRDGGGEIVVRRGGFLSNIDAFDASFFGLSRREATATDPQHRLLLEVGWEALEDAGLARERLKGSSTGVFVALIHNEYERLGYGGGGDADLYLAIGTSRNAAAGRFANVFGFAGPSLVVDTDRSSSLVAVHLACQSLRSGECLQALVGAANLILLPDLSRALSRAGMLSPDGVCRFGDRAANGFVRSEGVGAVVLKLLSNALADGDPIYAVIRGSAVNSDANRSGDLMAPSVDAQVDLLSAAFRNAAVDPGDLDYVEAHGTGTPVGDVVELRALGAVLAGARPAERPCLVGSVKTNIGHTEATAGLAGLIKVALAMRHRQWPASLHFEVPNPSIPFAEMRLSIPRALTAWQHREAPALAGVSAFGLTGTNAHVVLEAPPERREVSDSAELGEPQLLPLSAHDPDALHARVRDFVRWLSRDEGAGEGRAGRDLRDICYTAGVRRSHLRHRLAVVAPSGDRLRAHLEAYLEGAEPPGLSVTDPATDPATGPAAIAPPKLAFVFSGQGSPWLGMGKQLLDKAPIFRATLEACDAAMRPYRAWSLFDELRADRARSRLGEVEVVQPVLTAVQLALAALWESWGVVPAAVVGASIGELPAAWVAGIVTLPEAMRISCERSRVTREHVGPGRIALVSAPVDVVRRQLEKHGGRVSISGINSREKVLVAGEASAVEAAVRALGDEGVVCQPVNAPAPVHCALLDPACPPLHRALAGLRGRAARIPFHSCVTAGEAAGEAIDGPYWVKNFREPVLFGPTVEKLIADGFNLFLEISPNPILWDAILDGAHATGHRVRVAPSLRAHRDEPSALLESLGALYTAGYPVDWAKQHPAPRSCLGFPTYPWARQQRYWVAAQAADQTPAGGPVPEVTALHAPAPAPVPEKSVAGGPVTLARRLASASSREAKEILASFLGDRIARALGEPASVDPHRPFKDLGLTSLMLVEIRTALSRALERSFHATLLFDHPTVDALATFLAAAPPSVGSPAIATSHEVRPAGAHEPIAIIGIGLKLPGGATDPKTYWHLLSHGVDAITDIPSARWDPDLHFDADPDAPGKMYSRWGGFIDGVDQFDPQFFGISRREADRMDPQQRLLLEVAWEALEHAGYSAHALHGTRTGVFVGMSNTDDYARLKSLGDRPEGIGSHDGTGDAISIAAGRLSYVFGLRGPALAIDTACSSSLVAIHLACQSLRSGESTLALAGGVNVILTPHSHIAYCKARMLSAKGRCKTFDAAADGYVRGEGCGVVMLRPLSSAVAAGDNILAVIRGSAVNQDGRSNGLTAPSGAAQEQLLRDAYAAAGVDPAEVSYIEAHGTGTSLGDPIEVQALGAVLSPGRIPGDRFLLGSVKTNIGHLEPAAGVAGLIKVVLSMQHGVIPAHLHFEAPNPHIAWQDIPCEVPTKATPWPSGARIAGVSSFGFSGTNAHVVVGEPPPAAHRGTPEVERHERPLHVLALSAPTDAGLTDLALRYDAYLAERATVTHEIGEDGGVTYVTRETGHPGDICFTANAGRSHWKHRAVAVGGTLGEIRQRLAARPRAETPEVHDAHDAHKAHKARDTRIAFLFTGQGSQYLEMGQQLYATQPTFRRTLSACADMLDGALERPLLEAMFERPGGASLLDQTAFAQPALFALEYSLAKLWQSWGVEPAMVLGHSVGEYAAACIAGTMSLADGLRLIAERGRLMQALPRTGAMMAFTADEDRLAQAIAPYQAVVSIAAVNAPNNTVISGDADAVAAIAAGLARDGIKATRLRTSHAFHSPLMDPIMGAFEVFARSASFERPRLPVISNVTGRAAEATQLCSPGYWARHLRAPVRFHDAVRCLVEDGVRIFVEIGPSPTLLGMARQGADTEDALWLPSLRRPQDDWSPLLESLAALYQAGVDVDWDAFDHDYARRRVPLPTYPFQRTRCWIEDAPHAPPRVRPARLGEHPFLGQEVTRTEQLAVFDSWIDATRLPFLDHHRVHGVVVVPAVVLLEAVLAASVQLHRGHAVSIHDFVIHQALALKDDSPGKRVQTILKELADGRFSAEIVSSVETGGDPVWTRHVTAAIDFSPQPASWPAFEAGGEAPEISVPGHDVYEALASRGLTLGPSFRVVESVRWRDLVADVRIGVPEAARWPGGFLLPPAVLDAAFHALLQVDRGMELHVPVTMEAIRYRPASEGAAPLASCRIRREGEGSMAGDFQLADGAGQPVLEVLGAGLRPVSRSILLRLAGADDERTNWVWNLEWRLRDRDDRDARAGSRVSGLWLIVADSASQDVGSLLAERLEEAGGECRLITLGAVASEAASDVGVPVVPVVPVIPVLDELQRSGNCQGIAFLGSPAAVASDELPAAAEAQCGAALRFLQAVLRAKWGQQTPRVWFVTLGAHAVGPGDAVTGVSSSCLWGLGRVLSHEHPAFYGGLVDLDPAASAAERAGDVLHAVSSTEHESQIAYRGGDRYALHLVRDPDGEQAGTSTFTIDPAGTYLITGGLGGLGREVAEWLSTQGAQHVILTSRRGPDDDALDFKQALEERRGVHLELVQADVTSEREMAAVLRDIQNAGRPLRGIFHAAGVLEDGALTSQDEHMLCRVTAPKVRGAWNLHRLTAELPLSLSLECFVLFSSASAVLGNPGQANYAAANCFLDALAHHRRARGMPALSIDWGPWARVGMASKSGGDRELSRRWGLAPIEPDEGVKALGRLLRSSAVQAIVMPIDLSKPAASRAGSTLYPGAMDPSPPSPRRDAAHDRASSELNQNLAAMSGEERHAVLARVVFEVVVHVMGLDAAQALPPYQPLNELGLDSLLAIDIMKALEKRLGRRLPTDLLLNAPSVEDLTDYLDKDLRG